MPVSPRRSRIFFLIDIPVVIFWRIKYNKAHNNQREYHKQEGYYRALGLTDIANAYGILKKDAYLEVERINLELNEGPYNSLPGNPNPVRGIDDYLYL